MREREREREREELIAGEDIVPAGGKLIGLFVTMLHLSFIDGLSCNFVKFLGGGCCVSSSSPLFIHTHTYRQVSDMQILISFNLKDISAPSRIPHYAAEKDKNEGV